MDEKEGDTVTYVTLMLFERLIAEGGRKND